MRHMILAAALAVSLAPIAASAVTLGFENVVLDGLTGVADYTNSSESGFTIAVDSSLQPVRASNNSSPFGTNAGNYLFTPYIGSTVGTQNHALDITRTGGGLFSLTNFQVSGLDGPLVSGNTYQGYFSGFLNGSQIVSDIAFNVQDGVLSTVMAGALSGITIDELRIVLPSDNATQFRSRIDNIEVAPVPVPGAALLFGPALLGLIGFARRKRA